MNKTDVTTAYVMIGTFILGLLIRMAIVGAIIWTVVHFVRKAW